MRADIESFFSSPAFGIVGVSADRKKFGNLAYRMMKEKQFTVFPVNPQRTAVEGDPCYADVARLPDEVQSVITVVPPPVTEAIVDECIRKGITAIWMQPGSGSDRAVEKARKAGMTVINGQCIMMFLEPVESFHALHRFLKKLFGTYPG